ncbi:hypothetical protein BD410DRAFT_33872 [Rickenella mellea]|uniref:Uncharacterized protein n=1 Tax=Rickenella mellea TaxID=50990 RepID=A0A4R5XET0_9AGAM|nr:hypothetical protein BD410DRAFT_33872 [Rickenella mellea]
MGNNCDYSQFGTTGLGQISFSLSISTTCPAAIMASFHDKTPTYLTSRSADVILSDVRPTKLRIDALQSINVLLDELLWLILSASRSFFTEKLKSGLLKVLPTTLGKEALLEAEVELRAYWERTSSANVNTVSPRPSEDNPQDFPLQPAFQLLRLKCEAYSTLNDTDEDPDAEAVWQTKIAQAGNLTPAKTASIAPAALYLTAILEAICEHVLSNTGRVTARDSSRTAATLQDLYVGLCEDDTVYPLFRTMRIHDQIESQLKASRPRRSKSISRADRVASPSRGFPTTEPLVAADVVGLPTKSRQSSDSGASGPQGGVPAPRTSMDKSKAKRMFRRGSGDVSLNGHGDASGHKRSESALSDAARRARSPFDSGTRTDMVDHEDDAMVQEFDDLMRSGATMKVSLTPDRLKTFEVYNKEKNKRANKPPTLPSTSSKRLPVATHALYDSSADNSTSEDITEFSRDGALLPPKMRNVDSIDESTEDNTSVSTLSQGRPRATSSSKVPTRIASPPPVPVHTARARSVSAAQLPLDRQAVPVEYLSQPETRTPERPPRTLPKTFDSPSAKAKFGSSRNIDPLDLDDVMNASDEDIREKKAFTPKSARAVGNGSRELLSFLNDGPPDVPSLPHAASAPTLDTKAKPGRFRSMVSRLTRGSSAERLAGQNSSDESSSPLRKNGSSFGSSINITPNFVPPPLSAKKSLRNLSAASLPQQIPLSPPISPSSIPSEGSTVPPSSYRQPAAVIRKPSVDQTNSINVNKDTPSQPLDDAVIQPPRQSSAKVRVTEPELNGVTNLTRKTATRSPSTSPHLPDQTFAASARTIPPRPNPPNGISPPATPVAHGFSATFKDLRRLMICATTADECRLILDTFIAQSKLGKAANEGDITESLPSPVEISEVQQNSLVEALLSEGSISVLPADTNDSYEHDLPTPTSKSHSPRLGS